MTVNTLQEKFTYHLEELYYVERQLVDLLDEIAADVSEGDLRDYLTDHRAETERHVERLEEVFEEIDERPETRPSPTFDALIEERDTFFEQAGGDADMRDLHDLGAVLKSEYLEIAAYENLIMLARKLDLSREVTKRLDDSLDDEQQTKKQLKSLADDSAVRKIFARLGG